MQTSFSSAQLAEPDIGEADRILRACVHCGFCLATCPTYLLLGDELDSPRGRIYLIKDMLENERTPTAKVVTHIDRCLSCLSCMTTCPSGVNYMHLVDLGRRTIEERYRRPAIERLVRAALAAVLPRPGLFRLALIAARALGPAARLFPGRMGAMLSLARARPHAPSATERPQVFPAQGPRRMRVALLTGCVQNVLAPTINEATVRLLTRHGCEVVVAKGMGCCGAIAHHLGKERPALASVRRNVAAWRREIEAGGLDAIVANASGCGTMLKDYGFLLREEPEWAEAAKRVAALARDVSEVVAALGLKAPAVETGQRVAYQSACSMQHGQRLVREPKALLSAAGFDVLDVPEGHICCGSAGTYNLLQPEIAAELRARKAANIARVSPELVASGNLGCMVQLAGALSVPVVHTVELLDWATGGPRPPSLNAS
ncbi:MAG: glycolate oxidase subunit GlcF [Proteobacteria bacterium]|nr:glycolate oxidase subunit GlcF [Pseudomonadota bacterium]